MVNELSPAAGPTFLLFSLRVRPETKGFDIRIFSHQVFDIRGPECAFLCNDRGDVFVRGHIKGDISYLYPFRRDPVSVEHMGNFLRPPFFDGNLFAGRNRKIDAAEGSGHVEGYLVFFAEDSQRIGADLVRNITVFRRPVGADNDEVYFSSSA